MSSFGGAYRPDLQTMILPADLEAGLDPRQPDVQLTATQKALVFHEWIHYLHNVSTIHGLASLAMMLSLWSNLRTAFWGCDWSHGEPPELESLLGDIQVSLRYMSGSRGSQNNNLPGNPKLSDVKFVEAK
ncbi:hypothetical protein, partial [Paraburkholderia kururiensis]|uniref:hypothetical protein n=1 Tax=Paraburkholderia kururiensis TaxID=984307 RepID=UPI001C3F4BDF